MPKDPPVHGYAVVATYPHDPTAYCQGLLYEDGVLYESTGREGQSSLRRVNLETGEVLLRKGVSSRLFAEGIVTWNDVIIQLTWRNNLALVYRKSDFEKLREHEYEGEGWGLTHDGRRLIRSDGTDTLHFHDPETFKETGSLRITSGGHPLPRLNELEYIQGEIWANLFQTDLIARISPETGKVLSYVNLAGLIPPGTLADPGGDVLNGIAYDAGRDRVFVTGKNWPRLFEIRVVTDS